MFTLLCLLCSRDLSGDQPIWVFMGVCLHLFYARRRAVAQNVPVAAASKAFWQHLPACRLYFLHFCIQHFSHEVSVDTTVLKGWADASNILHHLSVCPVTFGTRVETSVDPIFIFYHFQGSHRSFAGKVRGSCLWLLSSVCVCVCVI